MARHVNLISTASSAIEFVQGPSAARTCSGIRPQEAGARARVRPAGRKAGLCARADRAAGRPAEPQTGVCAGAHGPAPALLQEHAGELPASLPRCLANAVQPLDRRANEHVETFLLLLSVILSMGHGALDSLNQWFDIQPHIIAVSFPLGQEFALSTLWVLLPGFRRARLAAGPPVRLRGGHPLPASHGRRGCRRHCFTPAGRRGGQVVPARGGDGGAAGAA